MSFSHLKRRLKISIQCQEAVQTCCVISLFTRQSVGPRLLEDTSSNIIITVRVERAADVQVEGISYPTLELGNCMCNRVVPQGGKNQNP